MRFDKTTTQARQTSTDDLEAPGRWPKPGSERSPTRARYAGVEAPNSHGSGSGAMRAIAASGCAGSPQAIPHYDVIKKAFDRAFDIDAIRAFSDEPAQEACARLGAEAYAWGNAVVLSSANIGLHTVAHEVAHVAQQNGQRLAVAACADLEAGADRIADAIVRGEPVANLVAQQSGTAVAGEVQLKPARAHDPVATTPFVADAPTPARGGSSRELLGVCDDGPRPGCHLSAAGRSNQLIMLAQGISHACGSFRMAIQEERIVARLKPTPDLWMLAVEVFFAAVQIASGSLAGALRMPVSRVVQTGKHVKTLGEEVFRVPDQIESVEAAQYTASFVNNAAKVATKTAKEGIKKAASKVTSQQSKLDFLNELDALLGMHAQAILEQAITELDDHQREALRTYYRSEHHTTARYQRELEKVLSVYGEDVDDLARGDKKAVRIQGPHGQRQQRLARCTVRRGMMPVGSQDAATSEPGITYFFDHWIRDGFERMSEDRQRELQKRDAKERARYTLLPGQREAAAREAGALQVIKSDAPDLIDLTGEVEKWAAASAPRFQPASYSADGVVTPGREDWPGRYGVPAAKEAAQ